MLTLIYKAVTSHSRRGYYQTNYSLTLCRLHRLNTAYRLVISIARLICERRATMSTDGFEDCVAGTFYGFSDTEYHPGETVNFQ